MSYCVSVDYEAIDVFNNCRNGKKFTALFFEYLKTMERFRTDPIEYNELDIFNMLLNIDNKTVSIDQTSQLPIILEHANLLSDCTEFHYHATYSYSTGHGVENVIIMRSFSDASEYFQDVLTDDIWGCVGLKSATEPDGVGDDEHIRLMQFDLNGLKYGADTLTEGIPPSEGVDTWASAYLDFGCFHKPNINSSLRERIEAAYSAFEVYNSGCDNLRGPEEWEDEGLTAYTREQNVEFPAAQFPLFIDQLRGFASLFSEAKGKFGISCWLYSYPGCNPPVFVWITDDEAYGIKIRYAAW